ncbi:MAG: response regulator transcription factor [FCB group bacterium]|jgi:DNA-binding NarL/FixJ family response regulator|nr:response regulator transcription factor [FCB group bacterium]
MAADSRTRPAILLVDEHRDVREAVAQWLEMNGLTVCAQASGREEALKLVDVRQPELALVDLSVDRNEGLALVGDLSKRGVPVVVCSTHEEPEYVRRSFAAGARAYVAKRDAGQGLVRTVRDVMLGWVLISPHAADDGPSALPERITNARGDCQTNAAAAVQP